MDVPYALTTFGLKCIVVNSRLSVSSNILSLNSTFSACIRLTFSCIFGGNPASVHPQSRDLTPLPSGCTLEIMWPRNIQNGFENICASLEFEADTFGVESNRFTNSATPPMSCKWHIACTAVSSDTKSK